MRQITIAFAAVAITALFVAPVSAEKLEGGPLKQHGQCWKKHSVGSDMSWGTWIACPDAGRRACDRCHDPPSDLSARHFNKGGQTSVWAPRSLWGPFYNGF